MKKIILCVVVLLTVLCGVSRADVQLPPVGHICHRADEVLNKCPDYKVGRDSYCQEEKVTDAKESYQHFNCIEVFLWEQCERYFRAQDQNRWQASKCVEILNTQRRSEDPDRANTWIWERCVRTHDKNEWETSVCDAILGNYCHDLTARLKEWEEMPPAEMEQRRGMCLLPGSARHGCPSYAIHELKRQSQTYKCEEVLSKSSQREKNDSISNDSTENQLHQNDLSYGLMGAGVFLLCGFALWLLLRARKK